jgi:hypothetical protein
MRAVIFLGAVLAGLLAVAHAADKRPKPPDSLCIGSNCVVTPIGGGKIKWNPGHYAASNGTLFPGVKASGWYPSMDGALTGYPHIKGYRLSITWGALETSKGQYDFSQVDAILNRLKTQYGTPRSLVLNLYHSGPGGKWTPGSPRILPTYVQQDPAYGPSPVAGVYGWWGIHANGQSTGQYQPALWRPAVMQRYIALVRAIAAHYDNDPNFEGLMFQEDVYNYSAMIAGSDYNGTTMSQQAKSLLVASVAAFPHTSVIFMNTWGVGDGGSTGAQNLEAWMVDNRVAPGTADVIGESAFLLPMTSGRPSALNWGMAAYMGMTDSGSKYSGGDLRQRSRAMVDVEPNDIAGPYYKSSGGPFTPADICKALNTRYMASHAFWDRFMGSETVMGQPIPEAAKWPNLAAALEKCPLTNTSYPPNYPQ